jgi:hypothetical protein
MRGGGDMSIPKDRLDDMSGDSLTFKDAGYFDYTGPVNFAEDRALKEAKKQKELLAALAGIGLLVYFF